ncbi:SbcC/MukB-like Walker B domain-containing protein [Paraburkholderia sp. GAS82]|uniref:SbcC/MukB-like Walker B domain-containing protein n=1 Tax=Paraburkholderia sp. GAS82 TaxID=3035137 RepID=UPI003D247653
MMKLHAVHLIQFFLFEAETITIDEVSGVFGPNGSGKSSFIDAVQIAMFGAQTRLMALNAQADDKKSTRSIHGYCLGQYGEGTEQRARDNATTYITLIWRDDETQTSASMGVCMYAAGDSESHEIQGLYVVPGIELSLADHLSQESGVERPRDWRTFRADLLRRAKATSEDEVIYKTSRQYVRAALALLRSDGSVPDHEAFQRAFRFALRMRFDKSVDQIVRDEVLETRPTNVKRFREVTDSFRALTQVVERIDSQITTGEEIVKHLEKAREHGLREASWTILAHDAAVEKARDAANQAKVASDEAGEAFENVLERRDAAAAMMENLTIEHETVKQLRDAHSSHADFGHLQHELNMRKEETKRHVISVQKFITEVATILRNVSSSACLKPCETELRDQHVALAELARSDLLELDPETVAVQLRPAIQAARSALELLLKAGQSAAQEITFLEQQKQQLEQNLARAQEGKAPLSDSVTQLSMALKDRGIHAVPVCDVVRVTDTRWQQSIEAYLSASNMEALIVDDADERRAFEIYRGMAGRGAVYGAKIVMSSRFEIRKSPAVGSVAELITGDNLVAVAFLRNILGDMRRAESNDEALRGQRTLTADGMLVGGGTMERLRPPKHLRLGMSAGEHKAELSQSLRNCHAELEKKLSEQKTLDVQCRMLYAVQSEKAVTDELRSKLGLAISAHLQGEAHASRLRGLADGEYQELCNKVTALQTQVAEASGKSASLIADTAKQEQIAAEKARRWAEAEELAERARVALAEERKNTPHDAIFADEQWDRLLLAHPNGDYGGMIALCERRAVAQASDHRSAVAQGMARFNKFIVDFQEHVDDQTRADWSRAHEWVTERVRHLRDTDLIEKREAMDEAYRTSQQTFRTDVAIALNNNLTWLNDTLTKLNDVLATCPAFSNGERYRFKRTLRPDHSRLCKFVQDIAAFGPEDDLLGGAGDLPEEFRSLLEEKAVAGAGSVRSPLDDYREFYEFDIEILRDALDGGRPRIVGHLSARIGPGSGGEHRAPLYVIAGAALASAYRLRPSQRNGIRLILLDEAFNKMDPNNITATMRYFEDLGLQVFLASPGEHQGILSAFLYRYYDIVRDPENNVVSISGHNVTQQMRDLMRSDLLEYHPELLQAEIAQLGKVAPDMLRAS